MKRKLYFLSIFLCLHFFSFSQNRNSVWCFGDSALIDFSDTANIVTGTSSVESRGSCSSICDTSGQLLFYVSYDIGVLIGGTDPVKAYNRNHQVMLNGDSMKGAGWYREISIVSDPNSDSLYYIFYVGVTHDYGIYYSLVNMNGDNGLGEIIQKNIQLQSFKCADGLASIKHGNGRDWWVLFRRWDSVNDEFYSYLISPSGISNVVVQHIGSPTNNGFTRLIFNKAGTKLLMINYFGLLETYNFDRCTGLLSNPTTIHFEPLFTYLHFWGADFSPNGRFLYVTTYEDTCYLYQYDLFSANPAITRITLDTTTDPLIGMGSVKRAIDEKIYIAHAWECPVAPSCYPYPDSVYNAVNMSLSVINHPDSIGNSCGYAPYSFNLGGNRSYYGLPNNPDYDLGLLIGSPCDTITGINHPKESNPEFFIYYSSNWQTAFINAQKLEGKEFSLQVLDALGKMVYKEEGKLNSQYFTRNLNCTSFANGLYVVTLQTDKEKLVKKFVKE